MSECERISPELTERLPLDQLRPLRNNPNRGDDATIREILTSLGQMEALVVNKGTHTGRPNEIAGGNTRYRVMADLGWTEAAVTYVDVDEQTLRKLVVALNRARDKAETDEEILADLLGSIAAEGSLLGTGYSDTEFDDLLAAISGDDPPFDYDDPYPHSDPAAQPPRPAPQPRVRNDPDEAPDTRPDPISRPGDRWLLGPHALVVGDATKAATWTALLHGERPDMIWTDPPYGVSYVGKTADALTLKNDNLDREALQCLIRTVFRIAASMTKPGAAWYVAHPPGPLHLTFGNILNELGVLRQTLIWVKDQFALGRSDYHYRHEPIYYGWTPGAAHHALPDRTQDSVWEVRRPRRSEMHPTMKPVELIAAHVLNSTHEGQLVADPFAGSGSTLIACHGANRRAALIELDLRFADVICRRWQDHAGILPIRRGVEHDFSGPVPETAGA